MKKLILTIIAVIFSATSIVAQAADKLLGRKLITNQTGPSGKIINRVYIEEATDIKAKQSFTGDAIDINSP